MASYNASATSGSSGSSGTGATHTVIVAPTQGVLRYVPFAINASVGDTIKFMWGANNHTVTKSSALLPCNKSSDALFTSGTQNKDFVCRFCQSQSRSLAQTHILSVTQVVNDTNPTFFYCGTPTHCQKGMFGIMLVLCFYAFHDTGLTLILVIPRMHLVLLHPSPTWCKAWAQTYVSSYPFTGSLLMYDAHRTPMLGPTPRSPSRSVLTTQVLHNGVETWTYPPSHRGHTLLSPRTSFTLATSWPPTQKCSRTMDSSTLATQHRLP